MAGTIATLRIAVQVLTAQASTAIAGLQSQIAASGTAMNSAVGLGAVGVAAGMAVAANEAIKWEDAMAGVRRTVIDTHDPLEKQNADMAALERQLLDLTGKIPIAHEQIAEMARQAGALGVPTEEVGKFVEAVATMSQLSDDLTPDLAATYFGKIRTVIGLTNDDFMKLTSSIVNLGVEGASTEGEILHMAQRFSGSAAAVGLNAQQLAGWAAAMANVGEQSEAGGSTLQRLFLISQRAVVAGTDKLDIMAKAAGMTSDAFANLFRTDASSAMAKFLTGMSKIDSETRTGLLKTLGFGDIRLTRGLNAMIQAIATGLQGNLNDALAESVEGWTDVEATTKMAEDRWSTTSKQIDLLFNDLRTLAIEIGKGLLPAINLVVDGLMYFAQGATAVVRALEPLMGIISPLIAALSAFLALKFASRIVGMLLPMGGGSVIGTAWAGLMQTAIIGPLSSGFAAATGLVTRGVAALQLILFNAFASMGMKGGIIGAIGNALAGGVLAGPRGLIAAAASKLGLTFGTTFALVAAGIIAKDLYDRLGNQYKETVDLAKKAAQTPAAMPGALSLEELNKQLEVVNTQIDKMGNANDQNLFQFAEDVTSFLTNQPHVELGDVRKDLEAQRAVILDEIQKIKDGVRKEAADPDARKALFDIWNPQRAGEGADAFGTALKRGALSVILGAQTAIEDAMSNVQNAIKEGFQASTEEVIKGFGNIKDALQNPPQLISKQDRLKNMAARMIKVNAQLAKAVKAKDPAGIRYWSNAVLNLKGKMDRLKNTHVASMKEVKRAHRNADKDIVHQAGMATKGATEKAKELRGNVVAQVVTMAAQIQSVNLYQAGVNIMTSFAEGLQSAISAVKTAVQAAGEMVANFLKGGSPTKMGPLSTIDQWGKPLVDTWARGFTKGNSLNPVRAAGAMVGGAFNPSPRMALASGMSMAERGRGDCYHVGTLIADERGLDELDRRTNRRRRHKTRGAGRRNNDPG